MHFYAFLDNDNFVIEVIPGVDINELLEGLSPEEFYSNLRGNRCIYYNLETNNRKNYPGKGYYYDEDKDAFIPPKIYSSWILDENTYNWIAPILVPEDGKYYSWDEKLNNWKAIEYIK